MIKIYKTLDNERLLHYELNDSGFHFKILHLKSKETLNFKHHRTSYKNFEGVEKDMPFYELLLVIND